MEATPAMSRPQRRKTMGGAPSNIPRPTTMTKSQQESTAAPDAAAATINNRRRMSISNAHSSKPPPSHRPPPSSRRQSLSAVPFGGPGPGPSRSAAAIPSRSAHANSQNKVIQITPSKTNAQFPPPSPSIMATTTALRQRNMQGGLSGSGSAQCMPSTPRQEQYQPPPMSSQHQIQSTPAKSSSFLSHQNIQEPQELQDLINDPAYQKYARQFLLQFLEERGYHVSTRTIMQPSSKDVERLFTFVIKQFDENAFKHNNNSSNHTSIKFEDQVYQFFRAIGYPSTFSRVSLITTTPASWRSLLAALFWLAKSISSGEIVAAMPTLESMHTTMSTVAAASAAAANAANIDDRDENATATQSSASLTFLQLLHFFDQAVNVYINEAHHCCITNNLLNLERKKEAFSDLYSRISEQLRVELERQLETNALLFDSIQAHHQAEEQVEVLYQNVVDLQSEFEKNRDFDTQQKERKANCAAKVKQEKAKLEAIEEQERCIKKEFIKAHNQLATQVMSVHEMIKLEARIKEHKEAIEREEQHIASTQAESDQLIQALAQVNRQCEVHWKDSFRAKLALLEDVLPRDFSTPVALVERWKNLKIDDLLQDPSILPEIKSILNTQGKERLEKYVTELHSKHKCALDAIESHSQHIQDRNALLKLWLEKQEALKLAADSETELHSVKMSTGRTELTLLEDNIAALDNPEALEVQMAAYERQCEELDVMRTTHQRDIVEREGKLNEVAQQALYLMTQHNKFVEDKWNELEAYKQSKLAEAPLFKPPPHLSQLFPATDKSLIND